MGWELWRLHAYASFMEQDTERVRRWWTVRKSAREKTFESDGEKMRLGTRGARLHESWPSQRGWQDILTTSDGCSATYVRRLNGFYPRITILARICSTASCKAKEAARLRYGGARSPGPRTIGIGAR